jgi:hypothetical protein
MDPGAGGGGVDVGLAATVVLRATLGALPECGAAAVCVLGLVAGANAGGELLLAVLDDGWALAVLGRGEAETFAAEAGADDAAVVTSVVGGCNRAAAAAGLAATLA